MNRFNLTDMTSTHDPKASLMLYDGHPVLQQFYRDIHKTATARIPEMRLNGCDGGESLFGADRFAQWEEAPCTAAFRCVNHMIIEGHLPMAFAGPIGTNRYSLDTREEITAKLWPL